MDGILDASFLATSRSAEPNAGLASFLAIALGVFFLHAFFRTVESRWPESYFEFGSPTDPIVSRSAARYGLFRLGPLFLVCLFAAVSLDRAAVDPTAAVILIAVMHLSYTTTRALVEVVTGKTPSAARTGRIAYHAVVTLSAVLVALVALWTRDELSSLIPGLNAVAATIWTALFAAVAGAYVARVTVNRQEDTATLVNRSLHEIDSSLLAEAKRQCSQHRIEWVLFASIMIVENLQRPRWVRAVERMKGRVWRRGSYGIMQVQAPAPISDEESIKRAAVLLDGLSIPRVSAPGAPQPWIDSMSVARLVRERYNPDEYFSQFVEKIATALDWDHSLVP